MRFDGTCTKLTAVDEHPLREWIAAIAFSAWPQQHRLSDHRMRPAMVSDIRWHGFGSVVADVTAFLLTKLRGVYPEASSFNPLLSVVMPGHSIEPHRDEQQPDWVCRIHVPLLTNDKAILYVGREAHHLELGFAYLVNTTKKHFVENLGDTPRVHYMFDVRA